MIATEEILCKAALKDETRRESNKSVQNHELNKWYVIVCDFNIKNKIVQYQEYS